MGFGTKDSTEPEKKKQKMKKNHIQVEMANLEYYIGMDFGLYVLLFQ